MALLGELNIRLRAEYARLGADLTEAERKLRGFQTRVRSIGRGFETFGRTLTRGITVPLAGIATAGTKFSVDFESALARSRILADLTTEQVDGLRGSVQQLAVESGRGPVELADALFFIVSSGIDAADALDVLTSSAKGATIGLGTTVEVANLTTSALNAYRESGLTAAAATDILTVAVQEGKLEASELTGAIARVLPIASELGIGFEQVAAAGAALSLTGNNAEEAMTQLGRVLDTFINATPETEKQLAAIGLRLSDVRKVVTQPNGLLTALNMLQEAVAKQPEAIRTLFPNIRALRGVLSLTGQNAAQVAEVFDRVTDSTGALNEAVEEANQTTQQRFNVALSQLTNSMIALGDVLKGDLIRLFEAFAGRVDALAQVFQGLDDTTKDSIVRFGLIAAAVGPLAFAFGKLLGVLPAIAKGFVTLTGVTTSFLAVLGVGGAAALAGGGLVFGLTLAASTALLVRTAFKQFQYELDVAKEKARKASKEFKDLTKTLLNLRDAAFFSRAGSDLDALSALGIDTNDVSQLDNLIETIDRRLTTIQSSKTTLTEFEQKEAQDLLKLYDALVARRKELVSPEDGGRGIVADILSGLSGAPGSRTEGVSLDIVEIAQARAGLDVRQSTLARQRGFDGFNQRDITLENVAANTRTTLEARGGLQPEQIDVLVKYAVALKKADFALAELQQRQAAEVTLSQTEQELRDQERLNVLLGNRVDLERVLSEDAIRGTDTGTGGLTQREIELRAEARSVYQNALSSGQTEDQAAALAKLAVETTNAKFAVDDLALSQERLNAGSIEAFDIMVALGQEATKLSDPLFLLASTVSSFADAFSQGMTQAITGAESFSEAMKNVAASVIESLVSLIIRAVVLNAVLAALGFTSTRLGLTGLASLAESARTQLNPAAPGRAGGGPVAAGQTYTVGELGPELFVPNTAGRIMTNASTGGTPAFEFHLHNEGPPLQSAGAPAQRGNTLELTVRQMVNKGLNEGAFDTAMRRNYASIRTGQ